VSESTERLEALSPNKSSILTIDLVQMPTIVPEHLSQLEQGRIDEDRERILLYLYLYTSANLSRAVLMRTGKGYCYTVPVHLSQLEQGRIDEDRERILLYLNTSANLSRAVLMRTGKGYYYTCTPQPP
jgi:hypothetical protein